MQVCEVCFRLIDGKHLGCVWIPFILLKTENLLLKTIKKKRDYCSLPQTLYICLNALFMSHEQALVKKEKEKKEEWKRKHSHETRIQTRTYSLIYCDMGHMANDGKVGNYSKWKINNSMWTLV